MDKVKQHATTLFVSRTNHGGIQLFRYLFVGGFAAVVDIGSLYVLTSIVGIHYLVSTAIAFILGTLVNYALSILWIFESSGEIKKELFLSTVIGGGGLLLNEVIIWLLVSRVSLFYLFAKIVSTFLVMLYNFIMRKKFVFVTEVPPVV